jgi:hypothetical protein
MVDPDDEALETPGSTGPSREVDSPVAADSAAHADVARPAGVVDADVFGEPTDITADAVAAAEQERRGSGLRRVRNIMLIVLAVAVVVAGVIVGPTAWQVIQQRNTKVTAPDRVADLQQNTGDGATETAEYIRDAIDTEVSLSASVGAVYWDGTNQDRSILFAGGSLRLWAPSSGLDDAFKVITDDTGGVRDVRTVPAGPLGGVMHCGTTKTDEGDISVCGWADHGSLAVALFPSRGVDESAKLMLDFRTAMERR